MSIEIELKIKITDEQLMLLTKWLTDNAEFKGEENHREVYLNNPNSTFFFTQKHGGYKDTMDYMRIRFSNKGDSVCLKHFYEDPKRPGETTHCDEYEYNVSDGEMALKLFEQLGYTDNTWMEKRRKKYDIKDFGIVIDNVKDLGIFVEVELKKEVDNIDEGKQQILELLKNIGIKKFLMQTRGYMSMLWNPGYEFGKEIMLD